MPDEPGGTDQPTAPEISAIPVPRLRRAFGVCAVVWLVLHGSGALGPLVEVTFVLLGTSTLCAIAYGLRRHVGSDRRTWYLIGSAFVVWTIGGGLREKYETLGDLSADRSLLPDVFSLSGYVLMLSGLFLMLERRLESREFNIDAALDALIVALAAAAVGWVTIVGPAVHEVRATPAVEALLVTYPALSIVAVTVLCRLGFSARMLALPAYRSMVASMALLLVGDVVYMLVELDRWAPGPNVRDLPYGAAMIVLSLGVLHPSMRELSRRATTWTPPTDRWRIRLVAVALLVPAALMFVTALRPTDRIAVGVISLLLAVTAVVRLLRALDAQATVQTRLAHAATHDDLTGLPNRTYLTSHLGETLYTAVTSGRVVGTLLVDVDQFKIVNDGLGHDLGDQLLVAVGERLASHVPQGDLVARLGADEFAVVTVADSPEDVASLADSLRASFVMPFRLDATDVRISVSIGVNVISGSAPTADWGTLLEDADAALFDAKRAGRNRVVSFAHGMRTEVDRRLRLEQELRRAVEAEELDVVFQPLVRLPDGTGKGFEALARWQHPELGPIPPTEFIPIAEETGLIDELGLFVLRRALGQLADWRSSGLATAAQMSVNVSPRQMLDAHLHAEVPRLLAGFGLDPADLQLEITEGLLVNDSGSARALLEDFRTTGVRVALDDFGTGYSSLAQLRRFPVDVVKVDRTFVTSLGSFPRTSDETLIAAIVAMSSALGMSTLAEGVETDQQADRLFELGVTSAQGFHFARPLTAAAATHWLRTERETPDTPDGIAHPHRNEPSR